MDFTNPTPADIKADFPAFSAVDDAVIQRRIDRTATRVDQTWGVEFTWGKELLTAHYLAEDGFGQSGDAEIQAYRASGVSSLKSASLAVTFTSDAVDDSAGEFGTTSYGRRFYALMKRLFSGPLTTGGGERCIAGQATDVPWAWRTGGFGL